MRYLFIAGLMLYSFFIIGCDTPEGGSSLPWSRPESWEGQAIQTGQE